MGGWRPLRSLPLLQSILSNRLYSSSSSSSGCQSSIQSSAFVKRRENKETLLETFGNNTLFSQDSNFAEEHQAELRILCRVNFMATALAEAPVLEEKVNGVECEEKKMHVVFVLGGPGSGKGTQCAKIVENFGFTHLSAGDLLRAEINSGSENGAMIQNMIKEGKIVPSEITVKLLQRAMWESENDKFLIDGFPRNEENRAAFELVTGIVPEFILFFDCPEEEMERRLLSRNQGRVDDNMETIRKRFKVFIESSVPVVNYYGTKGKVRKIDATGPIENIFDGIRVLFEPFVQVKEKENDVQEQENDVTEKENNVNS